jgi:hypothetical protein
MWNALDTIALHRVQKKYSEACKAYKAHCSRFFKMADSPPLPPRAKRKATPTDYALLNSGTKKKTSASSSTAKARSRGAQKSAVSAAFTSSLSAPTLPETQLCGFNLVPETENEPLSRPAAQVDFFSGLGDALYSQVAEGLELPASYYVGPSAPSQKVATWPVESASPLSETHRQVSHSPFRFSTCKFCNLIQLVLPGLSTRQKLAPAIGEHAVKPEHWRQYGYVLHPSQLS